MKYELVTWSESQEYMEEEWFDNESVLANEERFGSSAYFIPEKYIKKKPIQIIDFYDEEELDNLKEMSSVLKAPFLKSNLFKNPSVLIPLEIFDACRQIQREIGDYEFSIVLNGKWKGSELVLGKDFEIPKQEVSSASVEFDDIDDHKGNVIIHSHPKGVTSFSYDDDTTVNCNFECSLLFENDEFKDCTINFYFDDFVIQIVPEIKTEIRDLKIKGINNIKKKRSLFKTKKQKNSDYRSLYAGYY